MTIDEELNSPVVYNQFMNDNFLSSSSAVLNEDTALYEDLCTHRNLERDFYVCI